MNKIAIRKKYNKPAIKEAIFEAKFDYDNFDSAMPGQIFEQIKAQYPHKQDVQHQLIFLENNNSDAQKSGQFIQAPKIRARKTDNSELLQFGPGIALANRLKYSSWEDFMPAIKMIINSYITSACPTKLTRVGIRYINKFLIPEESINVSEYFNIGIQVPEKMLNLDGFSLLLVNKVDSDQKANDAPFNIRTRFLTDRLAPNEIGNKFILDIDCYANLNTTPEINHIIASATCAHNMLGEYFENIITDKMRTLMEVEQ